MMLLTPSLVVMLMNANNFREVSDQDGDGNLTNEEFVLAMYLINARLRKHITTIPTTLPLEWNISKSSAPPTPSPSASAGPPPLPGSPHQQHQQQFNMAQAQQQVEKEA